MIGVILSVAFLSMLIVIVFTLISIRRSEIRAKRVIDLPPSAIQDESKSSEKIDNNASSIWPVGERFNRYLIRKGYISVHNIVRSFFKAMDFLKDYLGAGYKYKFPWYMMIGTEESGKSSLLSGFTHDKLYDDDEENSSVIWWFLKNGVVLDVKGGAFIPNNGLNADDKSWNLILDMLSRYRSAQPINGIILTIPITELYGKNKLPIEEIRKKAQYIARKLNFAQNYIGMKLPVYVVVTKTDIVPGFQSFCSEIPVRNRNNMLGWSSPYSLDSIYYSKILDEGFSEFENELNEIRMEILAEASVSTTRDGIFVFPSELLTVRDPLSCYIDTIFRTSSADNKFYFRGFYFTGDSKMIPLLSFDSSNEQDETIAIMGTPDADINEAGSISASFKDERFAPKKIFFFEDLLLRKIFAENGIASPMHSKIHQFNKSILIAKISTAIFVTIGSYGLLSSRDKLSRSRDFIFPSLFKMSSLIKSAGDLTFKSLEKDGNDILADCTSQLLSMMQQLNNVRFSSIFVPASWFSSINKDLTETLRIAYQRVVVRTIYMNLILKARELLSMKPSRESSSISEVLNPNNSLEYKYLKDYVFGLIQLEKHIKKFDSLRASADPKDLNDLIDYTFHGCLPKEFLDNYQDFRRILMNTPFPAVNLSPYKQVAYDTLINLYQRYLDTVFTTRSKNSIVSLLTGFIGLLSRQSIKEVPNCDVIKEFSRSLTAVCKELGEEGKTWLDNTVFEPDDEFNSLLDGIETLFGKEAAQRILDIAAINFGYLRSKLEEFNELLKKDSPDINKPTENASISSGIYLVEKCLAAICKAPFMETPGPHQLITDLPDGKMIFWDDALVQRAYDIGKSYEQFSTSTIKDFPQCMQEGITLLAKSNLFAVISSTIAKSQSVVDAPIGISSEITSEEILQKQVIELKGVSIKFINLLRILRDDTFGFVFGNLRIILNKIGFSLLDHIDRLLENQKPYCPSNVTFNYWDGENGAGLLAFSASDIEELDLYLQLQRSMITRLALDFAEPIVNFLNSDLIYDKNYGNHGQLTKWTRIVNNVVGAHKKDPTSSVTEVERFIKRTLNEYNLGNISSRIPLKELKGESGDYFLNIIREIKRGLMARGEVLLRKRNLARYRALRDYYTKYLETKYPFGGLDSADADLETVKEFFRMYDELGGSPEVILDQIYQLGADANGPYEFLKRVHDLRQFFGDLLQSQYEALKVRLEIDFMVNKKEETNTDYLVERKFRPNNDTVIEPITPEKSSIWYFGELIELSLRWAVGDNQSPKPVYNSKDPRMIIEDSTAKIQSSGNWAALRFMHEHKAAIVSSDISIPNQRILEFRIPLSNGKIARIFVGVTASHPKRLGSSGESNVRIPEIIGPMPDFSPSVLSVSNEAVLVNRNVVNIFEVPVADEPITQDNEKEQIGEETLDAASTKRNKIQKKPSRSDNSRLDSPRSRSKPIRPSSPQKPKDKSIVGDNSDASSGGQAQRSEAEEVLSVLESDENGGIDRKDSMVEVSETPIS
jgi:type VI secretion system protein ImpL